MTKGSFNKGSFNDKKFNQENYSSNEIVIDDENISKEEEVSNSHDLETDTETKTRTETQNENLTPEVVEEDVTDLRDSNKEESTKKDEKLIFLEELTLKNDFSNYKEVKNKFLEYLNIIETTPVYPTEFKTLFIDRLNHFTKLINDNVCVFLEGSSDDLILKIDNYKNTQEELTKQLDRAKREKETAVNYANEKLIAGPLKSFVETLQLSLTSSSKVTNEEFLKFIKEIKEFDGNLRKNLEKFNIFIYGKAGDKFDPHIHEAISQFPAQSEEQVGTIVFVSSEGFKLHDRIIEPAKVIVYS